MDEKGSEGAGGTNTRTLLSLLKHHMDGPRKATECSYSQLVRDIHDDPFKKTSPSIKRDPKTPKTCPHVPSFKCAVSVAVFP